MRLSVLDQSIVAAGRTAGDAIRETVTLAKACDGFGYHRFWVSEHHGYPGLAGSAPEVLLGALAMATRSIRIGSAATILSHLAPLKAAEQALVLAALAPGRIDLGIGRGPGADRATVYALNPAALDNPLAGIGFDRFSCDVADLLSLIRGERLPDDHVFAGVSAVPPPDDAAARPQPWIVGGTGYTARLAGSLGLPFAFAHFVADGAGGAATVEAYRRAFVPGPFGERPQLAVSVFAVAAPTDAEAEALFSPYARWRTARDAGRFLAIEPWSSAVSAVDPTSADLRSRSLFGRPEAVVDGLNDLCARYDADEIVIQVPVHNLAARVRSCRLIAEAAGLGPVRLPIASAERVGAASAHPAPALMEPSR